MLWLEQLCAMQLDRLPRMLTYSICDGKRKPGRHAYVGVIVFGVTCAIRGMIRRRGRGTGILGLVSHRVVLLWCGITQVMPLILSGVLGDIWLAECGISGGQRRRKRRRNIGHCAHLDIPHLANLLAL